MQNLRRTMQNYAEKKQKTEKTEKNKKKSA